MKVSVIIPVYNAEKYLRRCIESVLDQTYQDLEIILIDDGSTDSSRKICDEYVVKDLRIKMIHSKNHGVAHARNLGLDNATGEYIVFVDSDDYVLSKYIENLVDGIVKTKADVSITKFKRVYEDQLVNEEKETVTTEIWDSNQSIINMMLSIGTDSCVCSKLFDRKIFCNERFDEKLSVAEDMDFFYRILSSARSICFSGSVDYLYVQYNGSSVNSISDGKIDSLSVFERLMKSEQNIHVRDAICSKYISTCFHFLSVPGIKFDTRNKLIEMIKKYRNKMIWKRMVTTKVRMALLLSFISFDMVIRLNAR